MSKYFVYKKNIHTLQAVIVKYNINMKKMKTKVLFLMILFVTTVCAANAKDNDLIGTWKLVNEQSAAAGISNVKIFSSSHFMWVMFDKSGKLLNAGSASYIWEDGKYIETVTVSANPLFVGCKGIYTYKIEGKKLTVSGYFEKDGVKIGENNEIYERMD